MRSLIRVFALLFAGFLGVVQASADEPAAKSGVKLELRRAEDKPAEGLIEATVAHTNDKVYLHKKADATNDDIAEASSVEDGQGNPAVSIVFNEAGAKKVAALTAQHKDKRLAVLVDGKVICAPVVRATFSERAMITGKFTKDEVDRIVKGIVGKK